MHAIAVAKVLRPDQAEDEKALRDLREEAELLERISHPVIVRGFDAVLDGGFPHLLIEHLEGPSLRRLIRRGGPLAPEQLLPLALHVAGALHYLEQIGFVHLDVKPDNIIMGIPPRLIDLSIARSLERAARAKGPIGTDAYMAPEQCGVSRAGDIDTAADVWGLGVTVYEAIVGHLPFPGGRDDGTLEARFPQLAREPLPFPKDVPPVLADPVVSCLRRRPADRPTAEELAGALEPLVAALPKPSIVPRMRPRARRRSPG
jgi:eukaryotic-like serine/threonine-protein kinase